MQNIHNIESERLFEIIKAIKGICEIKLNKNFLFLAENLCKELFKLNHDNINKGKTNSWACGIVHALCVRNNLFKNKENGVKAIDIYAFFKVSSSTGLSKSKEIRSLVNLEEEKWSLELVKEFNNKEISITVDEEYEILNDENLKRAREIVNNAWNQKNFNKRVKLANEALKISDKCAEAYIILSFNNSLPREEAKKLAFRAVEIARNNIDDKIINKYKHKFLDFDFTRTYYSSKYRLGNLLWSIDEKKGAIKEFMDLIELYPEDTLMVRSSLMSWLIVEKMDKELNNLLKMYKEDYLASTKYTKALLLFKQGSKNDAIRSLRIANNANPFIIEFVLKQRKINKSFNKFKKLGSEEEAINYIRYGEEAWNSVFGAKEWLKEAKKIL